MNDIQFIEKISKNLTKADKIYLQELLKNTL